MASGWRAGWLDVDIFRWSDFLQSRTGSLDRVYTSDGNTPLIALLDRGGSADPRCGCGAGNNAELLKVKYPDC
jgi:hypothetical protein